MSSAPAEPAPAVSTSSDPVRRDCRLPPDIMEVALESAGVGVWVWHMNQERVRLCPRSLRLLGLEEGRLELDPPTFARHVHPDDMPSLIEEGLRMRRGDRNYACEYRMRVNGSWRWIRARGRLIEEPEPRVVGSLVDMTVEAQTRDILASRAWTEDSTRSDPRPAWSWTPESETFCLTPTAAALLGDPPDEQPKTRAEYVARIHPQDRAQCVLSREHPIDIQDGSPEGEYRWRRSDGQWIWMHERAVMVGERLEGGPRLSGLLENITVGHRLRTDQRHLLALVEGQRGRLEHDRSALRAILRELPVGVGVIQAADLRIEQLSDRERAWLGLAVAVGDTVDRLREVDPGLEPLAQAVTNAARHGASWSRTDLAIAGDSGVRTCDVHVHALRGADGNVEQVLYVRIDTTERVRAQEVSDALLRRLEAQRGWYEAVLDQLPTPLLIVEQVTGRSLFVNHAVDRMSPCQLQRYHSIDDYADIRLTSTDGLPLRPDEYPVVRAMRGETLTGTEVWWHIPGREARAVSVFSATLPAMHDRPPAVVVPFVDVTELRRAQAQLEQALKAKDEFLAMLSHELRAPLAPLMSAPDLLRLRADDAGQVHRVADLIERHVMHQSRMVDDLLDVSRILSGKLGLERQWTDVASLTRGVLESLSTEARGARIAVTAEVEAVVPDIWADPVRLRQVLWNLVSNALKFSTAGGRVGVRIEADTSSVRIRVTDQGIGIPADMIHRVFERFWQVDASMGRRHGGLGLGLSIARHIVERHGGTLRAESAGIGRGSTFEVELPFTSADADTPHTASRADPSSAVAELHGVRILLLDDAADARDILAELLQEEGATVVTACTSDEALEHGRRQAFDLVVTDLGMPGTDGYGFKRQLESQAPGCPPVIALSGYASESDRTRSMGAGFAAHVSKPIDFEQLIRTIRAVVDSRRRTS